MRRMMFALVLTGFAGIASAADGPTIARLQTIPEKLTLHDVRDSRSVVVLGVTAQGDTVDLTSEAKFIAEGDAISVDAERFVNPVAAGNAQLRIEARGLETRVPVEVVDVGPKPVDFVRDVEPFLSKTGCSQGTCHGGQQGKNGEKPAFGRHRARDPSTVIMVMACPGIPARVFPTIGNRHDKHRIVA